MPALIEYLLRLEIGSQARFHETKEEIQPSEASLRLNRRPEGVNPEPRFLRASL